MCVVIGTSNRLLCWHHTHTHNWFDRHACKMKIKIKKWTIQVYAIWIHAPCNFKWRLTNILQLLWPQQKPPFLLCFDAVGFFLIVDAFVYDFLPLSLCVCVRDLPSLLTYRRFFFPFWWEHHLSMHFSVYSRFFYDDNTVCAVSDTMCIGMHYMQFGRRSREKNANLAPNTN